MPILKEISTLATCPLTGRQGEIGLIEDAALVWQDGTIVWVGKAADLPEIYADEPVESAGGHVVIPGLVDAHTHLAFGGWRADEFAQRLAGVSYLDIAKAGGGIRKTMTQTRAASFEALHDRAHTILTQMAALGITTVEAKSGYGLNREAELKQLRVYQKLQETHPVRVVPTFLGAHIVSPEYAENRTGYIQLLTEDLIPQIARENLAQFCDVFVEETAFSINEARQILEAGKAHGLRPKLHADQLSAGGGAELAAEVGAASADHLECISETGIAMMKSAGVVAVSLPLASLYLNQPPVPARRLIEAGVPVAVATDFNPGSAPSFHLPLAMMLACTLQRMTPAEVLKGATIYAAQALDLSKQIGSLFPGYAADFTVLDAPSINDWLYHFRANACIRTVIAGREIYSSPNT